jgi:hypothetical protein
MTKPQLTSVSDHLDVIGRCLWGEPLLNVVDAVEPRHIRPEATKLILA